MERRIEYLQLDNEWRMVSVLDMSYCILSCGPLFGRGGPCIIALGIAISVASLSVEKFPAKSVEIGRRFCL